MERYALWRRGNPTALIEMKDVLPPRIWETVGFAHIADAPLDQLAASYLDPDGAPLLTEFVTHP